MAHFDHPRELTEAARGCVRSLFDAGATVVNQCPIIRGVNDRGPVLGELFQRLSWIGVQPYYPFQCRPTVGNKPYVVPLVEGYGVFSDARRRASGLGRRARYCMSHSTGKISMVGLDREHIYLRYHQAKDPSDEFRFVVFEPDDETFWVDELVPIGTGVRDSTATRRADERSVGRHGPRSSHRIPAGAVEPIPSGPGDGAS
jgi:L-lysine 2,3-aminomutase